MAYSFGADFTFWFYPLVDDAPAEVPAAVQSQTPAIYIFQDTPPSRAAAADGTGAVQSITSWTWNSAKNGWSFSVDGIDDPDPTGGSSLRTYWLAINFKLSSGEQTQTVLRAVELERPAGHLKAVEVTDSDLRRVYAQVDAYSTEAQRRQFVQLGLDQVKAALKAKGFKWGQLTRPDELKLAVIYRALAMLFLGQIESPGDKFSGLYDQFVGLAQVQLDGLSIEYDSDKDGKADAAPSFGSQGILLIR